MSARRIVPEEVPSLVQSSRPFVESSAEKKSVPHTSVRALENWIRSRMNVSDHVGAGAGAVARPELDAVGPVAGCEIQCAPRFGQEVRGAGSATRRNVLDQDRALARAVALPELSSARAVVGREEQRAPNGSQEVWEAGSRARVDVLDQGGAGGGAVALP
jgi:hypothetical protein